MVEQIARGKLLAGGKFIGSGSEIIYYRGLFFTQIRATQFRPRFFRSDLIETGVDGDARNPMFQWHRPGKLIELLKNLDEDHLAKVFLGGALRSVRANHFDHERIEVPHERARSLIVVSARSRHQRGEVEIVNHAHNNVSTLSDMTMAQAARLQTSLPEIFL